MSLELGEDNAEDEGPIGYLEVLNNSIQEAVHPPPPSLSWGTGR